MKQRLQIQQCFATDCGHRRQAHSAAGRWIEHPLRDLQESNFEVLFDAAAEQGAPIPGEKLVDRHNPVVPRMPRVKDFSRFNTMGVALSTCTTKTELISGWGRTCPKVELWSRRSNARARSSPCRGLVGCITVTLSPPKRSTGRRSPLRSNLRRSPGKIASPSDSDQVNHC